METAKGEIVELKKGAPWDIAVAMGLVFAAYPVAQFLDRWWLVFVGLAVMLLYVLIRDRNNLSVSGNSYSSFKPMSVGFVSFFSWE